MTAFTLDGLARPQGFPLEWQMSRAEQLLLQALVEQRRPRLSLEIGSYRGGSLQVLSHFSEQVISVDIDPGVPRLLEGRFPNVEFRIGDSREALPAIVEVLNEEGRSPDFILVDGAHETATVRDDINALLKLVFRTESVMVLHDSFNPPCREGMRQASWGKNPHTREVDLDFLPGEYNDGSWPGVPARSMWGGLAAAIFSPERRDYELLVQESGRAIFDAMVALSIHAPEKSLWSRISARSN